MLWTTSDHFESKVAEGYLCAGGIPSVVPVWFDSAGIRPPLHRPVGVKGRGDTGPVSTNRPISRYLRSPFGRRHIDIYILKAAAEGAAQMELNRSYGVLARSGQV